MIRDRNSNWSWTGNPDTREHDMKYFESISGLVAANAIPEIWAADVFRCCPYPASAFWDAPFIKHSVIY